MKTSYEDAEMESQSQPVISIHSQVVETARSVELEEPEDVPEKMSVRNVETYRSENSAATLEYPVISNDVSVREVLFEKCSNTAQRVALENSFVPIQSVESCSLEKPEACGDADSTKVVEPPKDFVPIQKMESFGSEPSDTSITQKVETCSDAGPTQKIEHIAERWSDSASQISLPGQAEDATSRNEEPISEMYYTASSEVSLLSDLEGPDKVAEEVPDSEKREVLAIAGHVAAMRERFENMTRANTPCPDLVRSLSPTTIDWRNVTPSPDRLS